MKINACSSSSLIVMLPSRIGPTIEPPALPKALKRTYGIALVGVTSPHTKTISSTPALSNGPTSLCLVMLLKKHERPNPVLYISPLFILASRDHHNTRILIRGRPPVRNLLTPDMRICHLQRVSRVIMLTLFNRQNHISAFRQDISLLNL